jgi:hypothetical protein
MQFPFNFDDVTFCFIFSYNISEFCYVFEKSSTLTLVLSVLERRIIKVLGLTLILTSNSLLAFFQEKISFSHIRRKNQQYILIVPSFTYFYVLAPTCFGSSLPS